MLKMRHISKIYRTDLIETHALRDFSLEVAAGEFIAVTGPSGSGKTTLLDCIAGLTDPDEGRIAIGGEDLYESEIQRNVVAWKRSIGYVHQDLALFPHLTAEQNVAYGLRSIGARERHIRSREILTAFRIDHLRDRRPAEISGGERQRVALARTLVTNPRALFTILTRTSSYGRRDT